VAGSLLLQGRWLGLRLGGRSWRLDTYEVHLVKKEDVKKEALS